MPIVDGKWLFNAMMRASRTPDPWMFPALRKLRASGRYILGALSNTVVFPVGHELAETAFGDAVRQFFDVFVSSAHVGLRKPDPKMYELALEKLNAFASQHAESERGEGLGWDQGVRADEVVFLDDIGENLKGARQLGFVTVKVGLGRAFEAVERLEDLTGLELAGEHPKIAVLPNYTKAKL